MINYVIGDDVFNLNVNDIVFVKNGDNGYFGVVREIEENFPHVERKILIHRPCYGDYVKFYASSNYATDKYKGITKIPKDLFGSMILYKEKLYKVLHFDISKTFPLKIENVKTKYSEWIGANDFVHVNWRKDDVEKVRTAEMFEEFKDKTCYRDDFENLEKGDTIVLKEAEKTEKAFEGVEFNMKMPFIFDHERLDEILAHDEAKRKLNENYGFLSLSRPENNIAIHSDGVKVTYARCGDLVASSRCHDNDKFDAWTGAKIALERLEKKFTEKAEREKKEKLLNNWYDSLTEEKKEFVKKKLREEKSQNAVKV